jgi:hypothetical protein
MDWQKCGVGLSMIVTAIATAGLFPATTLAQSVDILPLERGFYVRADETCAAASQAGTALLRRAGLQWATSQCVFDSIEKIGPTRYRVEQTCGDAAHRLRATATYEIPDRRSFSFKDDNGWEHAARFCAQRDLPSP